MLNYIRYILVILLLAFYFFSSNFGIEISKERMKTSIERKLPISKEILGTVIDVNQINIHKVYDDSYIELEIIGELKANSIVSIFAKSESFSIIALGEPELSENKINFYIEKIDTNSTSKLLKKVLTSKAFIKKISNTSFKIKKLEELSFYATVDSIEFHTDGSLLVKTSISLWIIILIVFITLLREIGLFLIFIYQRFISSKKGYKCALGQAKGNGTCSSITKNAFKERGFIHGIKTYFKTTRECKEIYEGTHGDCLDCDCNCGNLAPGSGMASRTCDNAACIGIGSLGQGCDNCGSC